MATRYYRENDTGDFIQVYWDRKLRNGDGTLTARGVAIAGSPMSMCTTGADPKWVRESCTLVRMEDVPMAYRIRF